MDSVDWILARYSSSIPVDPEEQEERMSWGGGNLPTASAYNIDVNNVNNNNNNNNNASHREGGRVVWEARVLVEGGSARLGR
jgi:hypothetical protein